MIRKSMDGRSWVVIPHESMDGLTCHDCPASSQRSKIRVVSCLDKGGGGRPADDKTNALCLIRPGLFGRVLADSPEARAELFAARVLRS